MKKPSLRTIRIGAITLIALSVGGMWFIKNRASATAGPASSTAASSTAAPATDDSSPEAKRQSIIEGPLNLTAAFDLDYYRSLGLPIILDFGAGWCAPCKAMAPILEELHETLKGRAIIRYIDVDKNRALSQGYPIRVIPTQFFFDAEGKPIKPDASFPLKINQYSVKDTGEHVLSSHEGGLDRAQMIALLEAMGMQ